MNSRKAWSRTLVVVGAFAMALGTVDPVEGSLLIVPGSGLVALGVFLGGKGRNVLLYWLAAFVLIAVGVGAMFALSTYGDLGGEGGPSIWWGVLILPYPVGWLMAVAGGIAGLVRFVMTKRQAAHP